MLRQILLDTETTGLDPQKGHRIIEIGCLELVNRKLTEQSFHVYINPERDIERGAEEVHGITSAFLQDKPLFSDIADEFLRYVNGAELIIHNAPFDVGFLDHELRRLRRGLKPITHYCTITDTLALARRKYPGQQNSLDALCRRLGVDNSNRQLHGALLDAELLAQVYLLLTGGQKSMFDAQESDAQGSEAADIDKSIGNAEHASKAQIDYRVVQASADELMQHEAFMAKLQQTDR